MDRRNSGFREFNDSASYIDRVTEPGLSICDHGYVHCADNISCVDYVFREVRVADVRSSEHRVERCTTNAYRRKAGALDQLCRGTVVASWSHHASSGDQLTEVLARVLQQAIPTLQISAGAHG